MGSRGLANVSFEALSAEMRRREKSATKLHVKRERLLAKLAAIESRIGVSGGTSEARSGSAARGRRAGGGGRRGPGIGRTANKVSLVEAMVKVLHGKTMGVSELAAAVKKSGYKSSSQNFRTIVNQALLKRKDKFKKLKRGEYTA